MLVSGMSKVKVRVEVYSIVPERVSFEEEKGELIKSSAYERAVIPGKIKINDYDMEIRDRYDVEFTENTSRKDYFLAKGYFPAVNVIQNDNSIIYEYNLDAQFSRLLFYFAVGEEHIYENLPDIEEINDGVSKTELIFTTEKVAGSGAGIGNKGQRQDACNNGHIYLSYFVGRRQTY